MVLKKRMRLVVLALLLTPLVLALVWYVSMHVTYSSRVEQELEILEASKEPYKVEDLFPALPPDDQNAAVMLARTWSDMRPMLSGIADLEEGREVAPEDRKAMNDWLEANDSLFEESLRALEKPHLVFRHEITEFGTAWQNQNDVNVVFSLMQVAPMRCLLKPEKAVETFNLIMSVVEGLGRSPAYQAERVYLVECLWPYIRHELESGPSDSFRRAFAKRLSTGRAEEWMAGYLRKTRADLIEIYGRFVRGELTPDELYPEGHRAGKLYWVQIYPGTPWYLRDYSEGLRYVRIELSHPRSYRRSTGMGGIEGAANAGDLELSVNRRSFLHQFGLDVYLRRAILLDARLSLARMALRLEARTPKDPCMPSRLIQEKEQDGKRVLWSVGENLIDNGSLDDDIVLRVPVE